LFDVQSKNSVRSGGLRVHLGAGCGAAERSQAKTLQGILCRLNAFSGHSDQVDTPFWILVNFYALSSVLKQAKTD